MSCPLVSARALRVAVPGSLALAFLAGHAGAQQFPQVGGNPLTTAANWSEGLECADVDNDGDLDLFVADGDGFSSAGTQRQNKLLINGGTGVFTDQSVARLGANLSNAKGVFTGDVDNDGWIDAMFANAFNTDTPFLYINNNGGAGIFLMDSATRGFTDVYSSASGQFGDVDNDGDLDVILNDSGNSFLGGAGGEPHLFFNDGTGHFTEASSGWSPPTKIAHMDVQLFDFDGDWDLDFFGTNRGNNSGGNHYLMLNDGTGAFTNASSLLPGTSSNSYEAEVSDLDNDTDVDAFFVSFSGFSEGHAVNNFFGSGTLTFSAGGSVGGTTQDDNEIALLDYDLDGDLDAVTGSLGSTEKIAKNNFIPSGTLSFTNDNTLIASVSDSTLDCTVADVTGDGAYDILTAQGESNSAQFRNKLYGNTGAADNLAPVVVREEAVAMPFATGPWVVRAEVRDQVMDDSRNWVTATATYTVSNSAKATQIVLTPQGFQPNAISIDQGTTVVFKNESGAALRLSSTTAGYDIDADLADGGHFAYKFLREGDYTFEDSRGAGFQLNAGGGGATVIDGFYQSGGMYRFAMTDTLGGTGTTLDYQLTFTDWNGNSTNTTPVQIGLTPFCGLTSYAEGLGGANIMMLNASGNPSLGGQVDFEYRPVTIDPGFLTFALGDFSLPLVGGTLVIDPFTIIFTFQSNSVGLLVTEPFIIPNDPTLAFISVYFQAFAFNLSFPPDFVTFSNGVKMTVCE